MSISKLQPKVAVIIPSLAHVTRDYLKVCVESLRATTNWDIIVVSNGTPHKPDLSDIYGITNHLHTRDQGQCNAVNIGLQFVSPDTDYVLVTNDDMYYAPGWDTYLYETYKESDDDGNEVEKKRFKNLVFSPNLVEPTNNAGSAPPFLKADGGFTLDEFKKDVVDEYIAEHAKNYEGKLGHEPGFNLPFFVRKDIMQTIGGYDVKYDPWGSNSDSDIQAKFHLAGLQTRRERDVLVYHFSQKSGTFDGSHQELWQRNWDYFTNKWGFNRDMLGSDVWYSKDLISEELLKYKPEWKDKYVREQEEIDATQA